MWRGRLNLLGSVFGGQSYWSLCLVGNPIGHCVWWAILLVTVWWVILLFGGQSYCLVGNPIVWWAILLFGGQSYCLLCNSIVWWAILLFDGQSYCLVGNPIVWWAILLFGGQSYLSLSFVGNILDCLSVGGNNCHSEK